MIAFLFVSDDINRLWYICSKSRYFINIVYIDIIMQVNIDEMIFIHQETWKYCWSVGFFLVMSSLESHLQSHFVQCLSGQPSHTEITPTVKKRVNIMSMMWYHVIKWIERHALGLYWWNWPQRDFCQTSNRQCTEGLNMKDKKRSSKMLWYMEYENTQFR